MTHFTRRRFLTISAAALATPAHAAPVRWTGFALGAEVSLTILAPADLAHRAIQDAQDQLHTIESLFSLYDPTSAVSLLNRDGYLPHAPEMFRTLMDICSRVHDITGGMFDPTVQPLWQALASGQPTTTARHSIGWSRVQTDPVVRLAPGQKLTFNGIAQGFATDIIRARLARLGLSQALINMGEFAALNGPFTLGLSDPEHGIFATRTLNNRAIATSSPGAMTLPGGAAHIQNPRHDGRPLWSTVSVEARSAALADAASTAFAMMPVADIHKALRRLPTGTLATLLSTQGEVIELGHGL